MINSILPAESIFASYSQPKNISGLLISSKFSSTKKPEEANGKCFKCNNCILCKHLLVETSTFSGFHTSKKYKIKQELTCTTEGVIYLLNDLVCKKSYVGSTITNMRTRTAKYRNHIRTQHNGCEIATHFAQLGDSHPLPTPSEKAKKSVFQEIYNSKLSEQIEFVVIDHVAFPTDATTAEKRALIAKSEGYWQTQLRTMSKYGGLNIRDERKICNNKDSANKHITPEPNSAKKPTPAQKSKSLEIKIPGVKPKPNAAPSESPVLRRSNRVRKNPAGCHVRD